MVYPIVCARCAGSKLYDVDGNEYIDLVNGFGQTAFGHSPKFVVEAVKDQLDKGFAIGPQSRARRQGGGPDLRNDRQRARDVLQYGLGGRDGRHAAWHAR